MNGSPKTWAVLCVVLFGGGGVTAKGVNDYRIALEHRLTEAEGKLEACEAGVSKGEEWRIAWSTEWGSEGTGIPGMDAAQNTKIEEHDALLETLVVRLEDVDRQLLKHDRFHVEGLRYTQAEGDRLTGFVEHAVVAGLKDDPELKKALLQRVLSDIQSLRRN